jgi:hypothetical protein
LLNNAADIFRRFLYSRLARRTLVLGYFSTANTRTTSLCSTLFNTGRRPACRPSNSAPLQRASRCCAELANDLLEELARDG